MEASPERVDAAGWLPLYFFLMFSPLPEHRLPSLLPPRARAKKGKCCPGELLSNHSPVFKSLKSFKSLNT